MQIRPDLSLRALAPGVLLHASWKTLPQFGPVRSNGLVVLGAREALLIDTTWDDESTAALLDYVQRELHRPITRLIVTHSHQDRIGGLRTALGRNVRVHALELTAQRATARGHPAPSATFAAEAVVTLDGVRAEAFFPGPAHSPDNVVVWLPDSGVLFGSCMIRAASDTSVGNREDAWLDTWPDAIRAIEARVSPSIVVPGHGEPGDASLLGHTRTLVEAASSSP